MKIVRFVLSAALVLSFAACSGTITTPETVPPTAEGSHGFGSGTLLDSSTTPPDTTAALDGSHGFGSGT